MFRNQKTFRRGKTSKNWKFELMRWLKRKKVQASQPDFKPWEPHSCPLTSTGPWYMYIYVSSLCIGLPPSFSSAKALSDFPTFTFISLSYLSDTNRAPSLFCIVCTIFRGLSSYYMPSSVFSP